MSGVGGGWSPDRAWERSLLPTMAADAYLNTGGAGPLPIPAGDAMRAMIATQLAHGRMSARGVDEARERQAALRSAVARLLGRPASEIAIAQSSTHAMNQVIWGCGLGPGDEVVTTSMEHPGLVVPLARAAARSGARLRLIDAGDGDVPLADRVAAVCSRRTRLVALSHVSWLTGAVLDVAGAAEAARAVGALVLVDGAQAAGAIPVRPEAIGAHAYALPAQKWLLGPEGLGALWVASEAMERLDVTVSGYETGTGHGVDGSVVMHPDARRFEASTHPEILLAGWTASLAWLESIGWERIHRQTIQAATAFRAVLADIPGVRLDGPLGSGSGLVAFSLAGLPPERAAARLAAAGVIVRPLPAPGGLRASCAFFTDGSDLERLASGLGDAAAC